MQVWALILIAFLSAVGLWIYYSFHYSVRPKAPGGIEDPLRRAFLKYSVVSSLLLLIGQGWVGLSELFKSLIYRVEFKPFLIAEADQIAPGSAIHFIMPVDPEMFPSEHPCILIRLQNGEFVAYSARCTHLGCIVGFLKAESPSRQIYCACHAGYFNVYTGEPTEGPPKRPLPMVKLEIIDGKIYATGWVMEGA